MGDSDKEICLWVSLKYAEKASWFRHDKLKLLYEECLKLAQDIDDDSAKMIIYHHLASISFRHSQFTEAIKYNEASLNIAKQTEVQVAESIAYGSLGNCYNSLGDYEKAIHYHELALEIGRESGDKEAESRAYANLGNCYRSLGRYEKAIQYQEKCLVIAKQIGYKEAERGVYSNLGVCYHCLGQYRKAIRYHEMHLKISTQLGDKVAEGRAYGNLGNCFLALDLYDDAIRYYRKRLKVARQIGDQIGESRAHGALGTCYKAFNQFEKAIHHHELNLGIAKRIGDKLGEGSSHGSIGACYSEMGQNDIAVHHIEEHLSIAKQIGDKADEATARNNLGVCYLELNQNKEAELEAEKSLQCYEELFSNTPKEDHMKVSIRDTFIKTYRLLTEALLNQGKTEKALVVTEKGRARALADLMFNRFSVPCLEVTEPKFLDFRGMTEVAKMLMSPVLFLNFDLRGISQWLIQPTGEVIFNKECPAYKVSKVKQDIVTLINKAHEKNMVRDVSNCEDRSLHFLYPDDEADSASNVHYAMENFKISDDSHYPEVNTLNEADVKTRSAKPQLPENRSSSEGDLSRSDSNPLKVLYKLIFGHGRQYIKGNRLVIVADGVLNLVPFGALIDEEGHFVIESLQLSLVPSLTTAKMILDRPQEPEIRKKPLIVGDPDTSVIFPKIKRLPCAKEEAELIGKLFGVQPLTGKSATKENFLQLAENANLIHIAAHGDMKRGEVLLALNAGCNQETATKNDYMLMMSDLQNKIRRLTASLVVLSCCNSARGQVRADGVVGIARAFLGVGARSVLVTLWKIDDNATLFFMKVFYRYLFQGLRATEALQLAVKEIKNEKEFDDPRFWAPFVLIGDDVSLF